MKSWKPALTILCCLFVVVSSYHPAKHAHKHHTKGSKKVVSSYKAGKSYVPAPPKEVTEPPLDTVKTRRVTSPPRSQPPKDIESPTASTSTCPTCNPTPYNLTEEQVNPKYVELVSSIWDQNMTLTGAATNFVSFLKGLTTDSNPANVAMAIYTSFFINYFIPYLDQQPDACVLTEVINASLSCAVDNDQTALQSALTKLKDKYINDINPRLERTMAYSAECDFRCGESPPDPKVNQAVCYQNGFVYPIREIWELPRDASVSGLLQLFTYGFYNSTDFTEKLFAACATFALLEAPRKIFDALNANYIAEGIDLVSSSAIQPNCCYQRVARIKAIHEFYDADVISSINSTKQHYATTGCGATAATTAAP